MSSNDRVEVEAFIAGTLYACYVISRRLNLPRIDLDTKLVLDDARVLYPPFDPPPEPTKASRKGMKEPWEEGFFEEQSNTLGRGKRPTK